MRPCRSTSARASAFRNLSSVRCQYCHPLIAPRLGLVNHGCRPWITITWITPSPAAHEIVFLSWEAPVSPAYGLEPTWRDMDWPGEWRISSRVDCPLARLSGHHTLSLAFSPPKFLSFAMPSAHSLRSQTISPNRNIPPRASSPTFSETTNVSALNFGPNGPSRIITRSNLKQGIQAYEEVCFLCCDSVISMTQTTVSSYLANAQPIVLRSWRYRELRLGLRTLWKYVLGKSSMWYSLYP